MIVCAGQSLVDCIIKGEGEMAKSITLVPGGEALNEAMSFAALGDRVSLSSGIGTDFAGEVIRHMAGECGVRLIEGYTGLTPVALLRVDDTGNRKSTVSKIHELGGYLPEIPAGNIDAVLMGSLFRPPFLDPGQAFVTAKRAKDAGAILLADTKTPRGSDPHLSDYAETLALLDFITPNEQEALYYTGRESIREAAGVFSDFGVKNVIIKLAERGVYVSGGGKEFLLPAFKVDTADGVGAGDSFAAGFIHCILEGKDLKEAAIFGEACAAITVTGTGGIGSLRSLDQVIGFLSEHELHF